jgi:lysozyme
MRPIPEQAITLIKNFEGCRLTPYYDQAGILTIGIGHVIQAGENFIRITPEQAEQLLLQDLQKAARSVLRLITRPLTDGQYAALLSFVFNVGGAALQRSALRQKCNRHEDGQVPAEFLRWNKIINKKKGVVKVSKGLTRRRKAEAALYAYNHLGV